MILTIAIIYAVGVFVTPFLFGLADVNQELIFPGAIFWPLAALLILFGMAYAIGLRVADWGKQCF